MIDLRRYRRLLLTAYLVALLGATLAPVPASSYPASGLDKLVHVGLFAGLAFLILWYGSERTWYGAFRSFLLAAGAAGMIEVLQALLPFRNADLGDLVAGVLGAALGAAAAALLGGGRAGREGSPDAETG